MRYLTDDELGELERLFKDPTRGHLDRGLIIAALDSVLPLVAQNKELRQVLRQHRDQLQGMLVAASSIGARVHGLDANYWAQWLETQLRRIDTALSAEQP